MRKLILVLMLLGFVPGLAPGLVSQASAETVVIIVNSNTGLSNVSKDDLKRVFLGKTREIKGVKVTPVKPKNKRTYGVFRKKILGFSKKKEKIHWVKETLKGGLRLVKQVDSDQAVAEAVSSDTSGIGIVSQTAYETARSQGLRVKALSINGASHDSSDYLLN